MSVPDGLEPSTGTMVRLHQQGGGHREVVVPARDAMNEARSLAAGAGSVRLTNEGDGSWIGVVWDDERDYVRRFWKPALGETPDWRR